MIYVTHDQEEAFTMSTQVAVMSNGAIRQMAPPAQLYKAPADLMVARFVGELNTLPGIVKGGEGGLTFVDTPAGILSSAASGFADGERVVCGVRPEHVELRSAADMPAGNAVAATVRAVIFGGSWHRVDYEMSTGHSLRAEGRGEPPPVKEGEQVSVTFGSAQTMLFNDKE
jgi:ABC-type Fe3+/spermidine/putrescine transport system ATPase subunit